MVWLRVFAFFAAVTLVYAHPLGTSPGSRLLDLGPDTRLFLWTLAWDAHALGTRPLTLFDANIFYPEPSTLAYSEHQIGSALLAAPLVWTTGNLVLSMNAVLLLSSMLSGCFAYFLGRQLGLGRFAALTVGVVFLLTPPRFFRIGQLHLATVQWMPLCLGLLHRYARGGSRASLLGAAAAFWLQALSGGQSALFLALAAAGLLFYLAFFGELRPRTPLFRDAALALGLSLGLNLPFLLPYLEVQRELGLERSLEEAVFWSPNPESFLASPAHLHRLAYETFGIAARLEREAKAYLFPGMVPLALALAAFVPAARRRGVAPLVRRPRAGPSLRVLDASIVVFLLGALLLEGAGGLRFSFLGLRFSAGGGGRAALLALVLAGVRIAIHRGRAFAFEGELARLRERARSFLEPRFGIEGGFYLGLAALSFWASLGPQAGLYAALYRLLPGFDFIRVPSRLTLLTVLALSVLAGIGLERLRSLGPGARRVAVALFVLALVELAAFPLETRSYRIDVSPMDRFLAGEEPGPVAVFPIPDPRETIPAASRHSQYMLQSTHHFFPLVNGYSGFTPERHDRLFRMLAGFPNEEGLDDLEALGVRYAVFHREGYDGEGWDTVLEGLEKYPDRLTVAARFEEGLVIELSPGRRDRESSGASRSRSSSTRPASAP